MSAQTEKSILEAGHTLDARIAATVMGWQDVAVDERALGKRSQGIPPGSHKQYVPYYSKDISAAWEVVEKMKERFGDVQVLANNFTRHPGWWECSIEHAIRDEVLACVEAETAPHAICLAALNAVEAKV